MSYALKKWLNTRRNNLEFRLRRTVLKSYPQIVYIDPINICNLRCPQCPSGQRKIPGPLGRMSLELFKEVASALGPTARQLHLYNWGEPLLHPDILPMIRFAATFGAKTYLSTNLTTLRPGMAEELVTSGLDMLNASIDGMTQASYESYRAGGDLATVLANLRAVAETRRKTPSSPLTVRWQFLINKHNETEVDEARRMAADIGVVFRVKRMNFSVDVTKQSVADLVQADQQWLPETERLNRYKREPKRTFCRQLWDRTVINMDGSVTPCCQLYLPSHAFVGQFDAEFGRIWNGPQYVAARTMFKTGRIPPEAAGLVCAPCMQLGNVL
jgi:MoaA/NifB/PqqE/SkfB family radical SAM enzyme